MNRARRELADKILALFEGSEGRAFTRQEIAELCGPWECQLSTAERAVRSAMNLLISEGHTFLSDGRAFMLHPDKVFYDKALHILMSMRDALSVRIARLKRQDPRRRPRQPKLWEGTPCQ
jgi:hypothetical protein